MNPLCLIFISCAAFMTVSCNSKKTEAREKPEDVSPAPPEKDVRISLQQIKTDQLELKKKVVTISDASSLVSLLDQLGRSTDQWFALMPEFNTLKDPDGSLATIAKDTGRAMGFNYKSIQTHGAAFKDDAMVSKKWEKMLADARKLSE